MPPHSIDRDRARLRTLLVHELRRGVFLIGLLIAIGGPLAIVVVLGRAGHASDRVAAISIGTLALALAAGNATRLLRMSATARRLCELAARPDLIVWIYEQELADGSHIYVCSRRGERLAITAQGARRDDVVALLARLVPRAPRGFSRARDAAFEQDPLSVASS
jgi:hypothetical protein